MFWACVVSFYSAITARMRRNWKRTKTTTNVLDSSPAKSHFYFYKAKFAFFQLLDLSTDLRNRINNEIVIYVPSAGRRCSRMSVFF